ncbi:unnamed protein product [Pleuronectes platessa]|uniref:Uncharacterized protein n=1 Tax=Pleuronectes platessa TaxID=8262 RepID=A0A9N7YFP0_PLEPL|nr:unnamed protein product [Pleuronectes platessa]
MTEGKETEMSEPPAEIMIGTLASVSRIRGPSLLSTISPARVLRTAPGPRVRLSLGRKEKEMIMTMCCHKMTEGKERNDRSTGRDYHWDTRQRQPEQRTRPAEHYHPSAGPSECK